ncbi:MAG: dihydrodipicolinate synthase family protein [Chloroflexi bacterium]|jgi:4-hydroxy-tetrahydrodipicolinate synthase|nr:dihydrodipicolinate synthase family protein [Chloroflexota bacterium]MBT5476968.1 dihydrodipicolinate synthase family protein [Chloroflexota bacterium]MBT7079391.1 dihydrodipicolinate synthase family protein [Chloroflexota bacterium]
MTNNTTDQYRGIYGIPATPFNEDETLDIRSLESVLDFSVENGCHGIVMPVMASEYQALTDTERKQVFDITTKVVANRVPTVAGVSGISNIHSLELAKYAEDAGFDSVIAMPPFNIARPSTAEVRNFFELLSDAIDIPIWIQNHSLGAPFSAAQLADLCENVENVSYVKEETTFAAQLTTALLDQAGDSVKGVMGGMGCKFLISEFNRGMCGNMPASHFGDIHSKMWNLLEDGDESGARAIHTRMAPLNNYESLYGMRAFKEVLCRRGVITSPTTRSPGKSTLDKYDLAEYDMLLGSIDDLMTWKAS